MPVALRNLSSEPLIVSDYYDLIDFDMKEVINEKYKYSQLTGKIIGCSMEVHKILGNGFQEVVYQRALEEEFILQEVSALREFEMLIFYKEKICWHKTS